MIDLHSHTFFSDGMLVASELARRAEAKGLTALGMTDHGDLSNIDFIVPRLVEVARRLNDVMKLHLIPGIELTHVHPAHISEAAEMARSLGARIVIVHGETVVEPVASGTNRAAIEAGVDVLAHPGCITLEEAKLAAEKGVSEKQLQALHPQRINEGLTGLLAEGLVEKRGRYYYLAEG